MPRLGNPAASTAAPQPPNTSQNVPKNSAATRRPVSLPIVSPNSAQPVSGGLSGTSKRASESPDNGRGQRRLSCSNSRFCGCGEPAVNGESVLFVLEELSTQRHLDAVAFRVGVVIG